MTLPRTYLAYVNDGNHPTVIHAYSWQDARDQAKDMYGHKLISVRAPDSVGQDAYIAGLRRAQELAKEHAWGRMGADIDWAEYDKAIDAEAAKERT
jgi:hypothetical protein